MKHYLKKGEMKNIDINGAKVQDKFYGPTVWTPHSL